jgi:energy-coupling factor transporter ATP-binding protein EcfA2
MECSFVKSAIGRIINIMSDPKTKENKCLLQSIQGSEECNTNKSKVCLSLIDNIEPCTLGTAQVGADVYRDVEFFSNINDDYQKTKTVFDSIGSGHLQGTQHVSRHILSVPISDIELLKQRRSILEDLEAKSPQHEQSWDILKKHEKDVIWFFEDVDQNMEDLYNIVFFRFSLLRGFNHSGKVLTGYNIYRILLSPIIGVLSPIVYFIIPYFIIVFKFKFKISFHRYIRMIFSTMMSDPTAIFFGGGGKTKYFKAISYAFSLFFYFQGLFNSVELSRSLYKISNLLVNKINGVITYLKTANTVINALWNPEIEKTFFNWKNNIQQGSLDIINTLKVIDFSLFSNFGEQLKQYKFLNKDLIKAIVSKSYVLDSLISLIKFKNDNAFDYTTYTVHGNKPILKIKEMWHPCLDKDKVIKNDFNLGQEQPNNAIITGPNAGGKSTFVKTVLINIILSQTCCISNSTNCKMTPFHYINSQISIPDCKGYESLFQAELFRCKNNLDVIHSLDKSKYAFIIMDEIFNSTNVVEGISGAYAIAKKMSEYNNSMVLFTTHFTYLTKLEKNTKRFKNYKMNVIMEGENIIFPYKLSKGVSKQYIALELLKKKGFDQDIIDEALKIKNKFV